MRAARVTAAAPGRPGAALAVGGGREFHRERRPHADGALDGHASAVHLSHVLDDAEAESGAPGRARAGSVHSVEGFEDALPVVARDAAVSYTHLRAHETVLD